MSGIRRAGRRRRPVATVFAAARRFVCNMLDGLGLAGCLFAGVPVPQLTLDHARANQRSDNRNGGALGGRTRNDDPALEQGQGQSQGQGQGDGQGQGPRAQRDRTQRERTRDRRIRSNRSRTDWIQRPGLGPAPIIAGDCPPPAHPERLVPDQPWTEAERQIWNELRDVVVWPH